MINLFQEGTEAVAAAAQQAGEALNAGAAQAADAVNEAAQATPQGGSGWSFWIMIIAMIAIMYFFMWRPESKRRKEAQKFRDGLKAGDKVITAGGIYAVVKKVEETSLLIEVDSNVTLRIDKGMVVAAPQTSENK
jgi:preprotein translocase subunit YajC